MFISEAKPLKNIPVRRNSNQIYVLRKQDGPTQNKMPYIDLPGTLMHLEYVQILLLVIHKLNAGAHCCQYQ